MQESSEVLAIISEYLKAHPDRMIPIDATGKVASTGYTPIIFGFNHANWETHQLPASCYHGCLRWIDKWNEEDDLTEQAAYEAEFKEMVEEGSYVMLPSGSYVRSQSSIDADRYGESFSMILD